MSRKMSAISGIDITETSTCILCSVPIFCIVGFLWGKEVGVGGALDLSS